MPEQLQTGRTWGLAVNLYALRSERNWGVGDLGDLRTLVAWLSGLNAGLVGINPLHEIPNTVPFGISPYSPVSRLYRNFIYIDIERVPEISQIPGSDRSGAKGSVCSEKASASTIRAWRPSSRSCSSRPLKYSTRTIISKALRAAEHSGNTCRRKERRSRSMRSFWRFPNT